MLARLINIGLLAAYVAAVSYLLARVSCEALNLGIGCLISVAVVLGVPTMLVLFALICSGQTSEEEDAGV